MTSPYGVPSATNTTPWATRPCWTIHFVGPGYAGQFEYHVQREAEARSRFAADDPVATITAAVFTEVPF